MRRTILLLALFYPNISAADEFFSSLRDFQTRLKVKPGADVVCATYPGGAWCDAQSSTAPSKKQLAIVYVNRRPDPQEQQGQLFSLLENEGRYQLLESSPLLFSQTAHGFVLSDLGFTGATEFTASFCEGSMLYCEKYTFWLTDKTWSAVSVSTQSLGSITDPETGESFMDDTSSYFLDFKTGVSVLRSKDETGKPLKPVQKQHKPQRITLSNFTPIVE